MEIVKNVKVPNSVMVSGSFCTPVEMFDYLMQYGSIAQIIKVDHSESELDKLVIIEFKSDKAVEAFEAILPFDMSSSPDNLQCDYTRKHIQQLLCSFLSLKA